jgi:hypothetical protein
MPPASTGQGSFSNIFVSLTGGSTHVREKTVLAIFAVTILGLLRFSVAALKEIATISWVPLRFSWIPFCSTICAIIWYSVYPYWEERSPEILVAVAAILTVDALMRRKFHQPKAFDWAGTLSLICGIGVPAFGMDEDSWGHPWLLPTYGISFVVSLLTHLAARLRIPSWFV